MHQETNIDSQTLIADFCSRFDIHPTAYPKTKVGNFSIVNADQKDLDGVIDKIWRKMSEEKLDHEYVNGHEAETFNMLRDYARCGILMHDFAEAPLIINVLQDCLGGKIAVHNRDTYKAFHLHSQLDGINCEIQFHTYETYPLKQASDISYQKWRKAMAEDKNAVLHNPDYIEENKVLGPLCKSVYDRSGFDRTLPDIEKLQERNQPIPPMAYQGIGEIYSRAAHVQKRLLSIVETALRTVTQYLSPKVTGDYEFDDDKMLDLRDLIKQNTPGKEQ